MRSSRRKGEFTFHLALVSCSLHVIAIVCFKQNFQTKLNHMYYCDRNINYMLIKCHPRISWNISRRFCSQNNHCTYLYIAVWELCQFKKKSFQSMTGFFLCQGILCANLHGYKKRKKDERSFRDSVEEPLGISDGDTGAEERGRETLAAN